MKADELRNKTVAELESELASLKDELFKLRFQHATNQLEKPAQISNVKKDIARVMTVIREQQLKATK